MVEVAVITRITTKITTTTTAEAFWEELHWPTETTKSTTTE